MHSVKVPLCAAVVQAAGMLVKAMRRCQLILAAHGQTFLCVSGAAQAAFCLHSCSVEESSWARSSAPYQQVSVSLYNLFTKCLGRETGIA